MFRFIEVRSRDHEFLASHIFGSLEYIFKVTFMSILPVIDTMKYRVCEIDADLEMLLACGARKCEGLIANQHQCISILALQGFDRLPEQFLQGYLRKPWSRKRSEDFWHVARHMCG